jgi:hypothetical protein
MNNFGITVGKMSKTNAAHAPLTLEELLVSSLAQTDALAKLLIEKGVITHKEFVAKLPKNAPCTNACLIQRDNRGIDGTIQRQTSGSRDSH